MVMSLLDNSLLVYTADNTLYHFLIIPTADSIRLHMCGSISFAGIVQVPSRVRSLSWLIPDAQKRTSPLFISPRPVSLEIGTVADKGQLTTDKQALETRPTT